MPSLAIAARHEDISAAPLPKAGEPDLEISGLAKAYAQDRYVFEEVGFTIRRGESVALIGANGAGKSTLLRCCVRLIEPSDGRIKLFGADLDAARPRTLRRMRAGVGFVFQRHNLVPRLSALSNVLHGALGRRGGPAFWSQACAPAAERCRALECLRQVGLADLTRQRADRLSGGQSQRIAIARALMQSPRMMFADEPVASLDPVAGEEVMELFSALIRQNGLTLLFTSHNLEHALRYGDRVIGLHGGRLVLDAAARDLRAADLRGLYGPA
jgi:phosphonate transport system ATP-binding protein